MNKKSKLETLRSVGANLQTTIHVIIFFYWKGLKSWRKTTDRLETILCKKSLDYSEKSLGQSKNQ